MNLDAITKFMDIKDKREEEKLHFNVSFSAEEKSSEGKVLFEITEGTLNLNGTVDTEQNTFITDNIIKRLAAMFDALKIGD